MIDIHTHILPGMDDGAVDILDTIEMARLAAMSGVTEIEIGRASCRERV